MKKLNVFIIVLISLVFFNCGGNKKSDIKEPESTKLAEIEGLIIHVNSDQIISNETISSKGFVTKEKSIFLWIKTEAEFGTIYNDGITKIHLDNGEFFGYSTGQPENCECCGSGYKINNNTWQFIGMTTGRAFTYDLVNHFHINDKPYIHSCSTESSDDNLNETLIGNDFKNSIDDLRIYNRELNREEIGLIYEEDK